MTSVDEWGPDRVVQLADVWNASSADEPLIEDELEACWHRGGVVLGSDDGVIVGHRAGSISFVDLLAVRPGARRAGLGSALLDALVEQLGGTDARVFQVGGSVPWYLWPGVDTANVAATHFFGSHGFASTATDVRNMDLDPQWHVKAPTAVGFEVRRVDDAGPVLAAVETEYPNWVDEVRRGIEHATVHAAFEGDRVLGIGAHSVNRLGWIGPMATFDAGRGRGVGTATLAAVSADLASAGYQRVEIAWIGPAAFYRKAAGATLGRAFAPLSTVVRPRASLL